MDYPRPIEQIHQIEVTTFCSLRCSYCPSPHLDKPIEKGGSGRTKEHMDMAVYRRALEWASQFAYQGTQDELALTGIGESLLHPHFVEMIALAREALPDKRITFSTNGLTLTDELCEQLAPHKPEIYISLHRPEKAKHAIDVAQRWGLLQDVNVSAATSAMDWAGQLDWPITARPSMCAFLQFGWCVVMADGRVTTCCHDATGAGVVGHVDDEIGSLSIQPWSAKGQGGRELGCGPCYQYPP